MKAQNDERLDVEQDEGSVILGRFASPVRLAVTRVLQDRDEEDNSHLRDELEQEARILVVTYAGIMPGWQSGKLADWSRRAADDEEQIRLLMTHQLRLALNQILNRQDSGSAISLDALIEYELEPADNGQEDRMIQRIDNRTQLDGYRKLYPMLCRNVFDGKTQAEIAEEEGVTDRAIRKRIAIEKRAFLTAYVQSRGLVTEGDETDEELAEAYGYLTDGADEPAPFPVAA